MRTLYSGDTFEHKGRTFRVTFEHDADADAPWENDCGRGIVTDWTTRAKKPGERLLCDDRSHKRYFDVQGTMEKARRDGWGLPNESLADLRAKLGREPTKGEIAARATDEEFEFLRLWCADQWEYVCVDVVMLDARGEETEYRDSCCGVESYKDYHVTFAYECAENCIAERKHAIAKRAKETRERNYWACRDVETRA